MDIVPDPIADHPVLTIDARLMDVPYWNRYVVIRPLGFTVPPTVALVAPIAVTDPVLTVGCTQANASDDMLNTSPIAIGRNRRKRRRWGMRLYSIGFPRFRKP
jgi:hypothetical protein